jgi:hypothetical protein
LIEKEFDAFRKNRVCKLQATKFKSEIANAGVALRTIPMTTIAVTRFFSTSEMNASERHRHSLALGLRMCSPDERSDIRVASTAKPACRHSASKTRVNALKAHAGYVVVL